MNLITWLNNTLTKKLKSNHKLPKSKILMIVNEISPIELKEFAAFIDKLETHNSKIQPKATTVVSLLYVINPQFDINNNQRLYNRLLKHDAQLSHALDKLNNAEQHLQLSYKPVSYLRQGDIKQEILECVQNLNIEYLLLAKVVLYSIGNTNMHCNVVTIDEIKNTSTMKPSVKLTNNSH